jgi:iron(III) transport system ATP-binding protein
MMEPPVYLDLKNISKHFQSRDGTGVVKAVDDVSVAIERGQFVTLLGPSGCGKTTTLRLIAGFEFPTTGSIVLDGEPINELPPNRRDMAMVFQSYAVFPHLNVYENVAYGPRLKKLGDKEIRQRVGAVLELTELQGLEQRAPNQLSGGQQQRVALARALVMQPKVLLFDEPLSNLDAKLRVQMRAEIRRIQQGLGITSVYVTHDQDEAMVLSDQIVVMSGGRIQQIGSAVEVYRRPANRFVADFIGRANFLEVEVVDKDESGWRFRLFDLVLSAASAARDFQRGDRALLMVRPESLRISPLPTRPEDALPATVIHTSYLGMIAEHDLEMHGQKLTALRHDPNEFDLYPPGTEVQLQFLRTNMYLLPLDGAAL